MFLFGADGDFGPTQIILIVVVVVALAALIVVPMFTNRKRQKQVSDLHNSLEIGDTVTTVGGIVGKVIEVRQTSATEKHFVLETGVEGSKSTMTFDINAIYLINNKIPSQARQTEPAAPAEDVFEQPAESVEATEDKQDEK